METCPTKDSFVRGFNLAFAAKHFLGDLKDAYMGNWPTLYRVSEMYGQGAATLWMRGMFLSLYAASNSKDPGLVAAVNMAADAFCADVYKRYPISTLIVFFQRFAAGRYSTPKDWRMSKHDNVGAAFYHDFLPERNAEIARIEAEERTKHAEARRQANTIPEGYTSRGWYEENVRRAKRGDMEAIRRLTAPHSTIEETLKWLESK